MTDTRSRTTRALAARALVTGGLAMLIVGAAACSKSKSAANGPPAPPVASVVDGRFVDDALRAVVQRAVAAHVTLAEAATKLADSVSPSCPADRAAVVAEWRLTRKAWDAASVYGFRPQIDAHLAADVDFWPVDPAVVDEAAEGDDPMTVTELETLGANAKGLPAIELLLFGDTPLRGRRCSYVARAAEAIAARASMVADEIGEQTDAITGAETALVDVLSLLADSVYIVCDQQLGMPSGNTVAAKPADPSTVHQGAGLMATTDIRLQLDEVQQAYTAGVQPIVIARYADASDPLLPVFQQADDAVAAIGDDLAVAITERPEAVSFATEQCRSIRRTFSTNVSGLLGVTINLPIGDGD